MVDRSTQLKLPEQERNKDVWYDSHVAFHDPRYVFKRYMNTGPVLEPWLIPQSEKAGCPADVNAELFPVPQKTEAGASLHDYYDFRIVPDSKLFYSKHSGKPLHAPFASFSTRNMKSIVAQVRKDMEQTLFPGFDKRNKSDPIPKFQKLKRVWFRN